LELHTSIFLSVLTRIPFFPVIHGPAPSTSPESMYSTVRQ